MKLLILRAIITKILFIAYQIVSKNNLFMLIESTHRGSNRWSNGQHYKFYFFGSQFNRE